MKHLARILSVYVFSRLVCSLIIYYGHYHRDPLADISGGWTGVDNWWLNPWTTYDSYWYLGIAQNGYEAHTTAFFPLYPFLLRLFGNDFQSMALGGVVFSHLLFLIALILVFYLTSKEHDSTVAHLTVWVICFFPSAAFWGAVYAESLFLALLAGTFLAARHERWGLCAILAFATALTRNPGFLLAIALLWEIRRHQNGFRNLGSRIYVPLAAFGAFLSVQGFYWWRFGSPFSGVLSQEYFSRRIMWPWKPLVKDVQELFQGVHNLGFYTLSITSVVVTVLAFLFIFLAYRKVPTSYLILIGGITLMNLIYARALSQSTISEIRYMGALFPFSQILAIGYIRLNRYRLIGPVMVGLQLFMFIVYSYNFGLKNVF